MRYYCDNCLRDNKTKSKYSHLKSKHHEEFEKYKHIILSLKNVDSKDVDEILYLYIKDHDKKFNHYLIKGEVKLVFNINQDCKYKMTGMIDNRTFISWLSYLREAIDSLKTEGYVFNPIAEKDFYLKHNMSAFEWKLIALINADKNLINKFPRIWRHPVNSKFCCYRV